jgi:ubiquinol-cytochrome c reductase cytochrome c subunit
LANLAKFRRNRFASVLVLFFALGLVSIGFTGVNKLVTPAAAKIGSEETLVDKGSALFAEGCSSCHGLNGQGTSDGPTLAGVGAASVHFQVSTGRMPMAAPGAQVMRKKPSYNEEETLALAAYVASFGPGPAIPSEEQVNEWINASVSEGGELFRTNCAQCHNFAGSGGALTNGKYAPSLGLATPLQIYEAMITGPQSMPIFSDKTLTPESKAAIIRYIQELNKSENPGGMDLGRLGPVTEGLVLWVVGLGVLIIFAVWIGARVR